MSDRNDALAVAMRALLAYREELDGMQPSASLDERMKSAVQAWSLDRRRHRPKHLLYWAAAATAAAILAAVLYLRLLPGGERHAAPELAAVLTQSGSSMTVLLTTADAGALQPPAAAVSPTEVAVFRVRASLGAAAAFAANRGPAENKYWVDVGVGNDGALRIVRVLPVDGPQTVVP